MANSIAGDSWAIRSQMQKVMCHLYYQKHSKKRHQSLTNCDTTSALLHYANCSSSRLAITAPVTAPRGVLLDQELQSQDFFKPLCPTVSSQTSALFLSCETAPCHPANWNSSAAPPLHTTSFNVPSARAALTGALGITDNPCRDE